MKVRLAIASDRSAANSTKSTHVLLDSGSTVSTLWTADHGASAQSVAISPDHTVYAGGEPVSSVSLRKYGADGTEETTGNWPAAQGTSSILALFCGPFNSHFILGNSFTTTIAQLRKITSDNTITWSRTHGNAVRGVSVDASGNVYMGGVRSSNITTRKYNSSGTQQWTADHGNTVRGITADGDGNVYTVGVSSSSITTRKYNSSGTQQWTANHGAQCNGVAVDDDGNVYTVGNRTSSITTRKYTSDGTEVTTGNWPIDHGLNVQGCVFINGHLYTSGTRTGNLTTRKYTPDGTLVWSWDAGAYTYAIAGALVIDTDAPALALPIRLGLPTATLAASNTTLAPGLALPFNLRLPLLIGDREDLVPGLALPVALRLPTIRLEHPRAHQFAEVYALYLGGVLLPFSSITCRRDAGGLGLTATIPSASAELLAAVAANEGGTLRVLRGPRFPDGSVQLDGLWSAPLDSWSWRGGPLVGSITLQARAPTVATGARPRSLRDISYIGSDRGARRLRGRIDSYLSPGDVALLGGGQSLLVSEITYTVQPGQAFMEVRGV